MDRTTMLKRLEAGYEPIDIAIEKWIDLKNDKDGSLWLYTGSGTCALCAVYCTDYGSCDSCPISKYDKPCGFFSSAYNKAMEYHNAQLMIDLLKEIKEKMKSEKCKEKQIEESKVYRIGQKFKHKHSGIIYMLVSCADFEVVLVDKENGYRYNESAHVKNCMQITKEEFKNIDDYDMFIPIEDDDAK